VKVIFLIKICAVLLKMFVIFEICVNLCHATLKIVVCTLMTIKSMTDYRMILKWDDIVISYERRAAA
jgi:hypothetical protein